MTKDKPIYFPITDINPEVGDYVRSVHWMVSFYAIVVRIRFLKGKKVGAWLDMYESGRACNNILHKNPHYYGKDRNTLEDWRKIKLFYEFEMKDVFRWYDWEFFYEYES